MSLTPAQKTAVAAWVAAGDNLSAVQKKLIEQFQLTLTYRDVRFLVDDLNLELKDAAPKVDASDVSKTPAKPATPAAARSGPPEKKGFTDKAKETLGLTNDDTAAADEAPSDGPEPIGEDDLEDLPPAGASTVSVDVDAVTLIPGAMASGTVTFSDGVTGKWVVDQYDRPGFTQVSQEGYRPKPEDAQAFMQQLSAQLQQRGF